MKQKWITQKQNNYKQQTGKNRGTAFIVDSCDIPRNQRRLDHLVNMAWTSQ